MERYNAGKASPQHYNHEQNYRNDEFKVPYTQTFNRSRRNSQSSRDNSMERYYQNPQHHPHPSHHHGYNQRRNYRGRNHSGSRENSMERPGATSARPNYNNNQNNMRNSISRDNSQERWSNRDALNWRQEPGNHPKNDTGISKNTDIKIAEMTKQFQSAIELQQQKHIPGVLVLPANVATTSNNSPPTKGHNGNQKSGMNYNANNSNNNNNNRNRHQPRFNNNNQQFVNNSTEFDQRQSTVAPIALSSGNNNNNADQFANNARPIWYDRNSEDYRRVHNKNLIDDLEQSDTELQNLINAGDLYNVSVRNILKYLIY